MPFSHFSSCFTPFGCHRKNVESQASYSVNSWKSIWVVISFCDYKLHDTNQVTKSSLFLLVRPFTLEPNSISNWRDLSIFKMCQGFEIQLVAKRKKKSYNPKVMQQESALKMSVQSYVQKSWHAIMEKSYLIMITAKIICSLTLYQYPKHSYCLHLRLVSVTWSNNSLVTTASLPNFTVLRIFAFLPVASSASILFCRLPRCTL